MNRNGVGSMANQAQYLGQLKQPFYSNQSHEQQQQQQQQPQQFTGIFSTATNLLSGASNSTAGGLFGNRQNLSKGQDTTLPAGQMSQQQHPPQHNSKILIIIIFYMLKLFS